jgi:hypothetical protein
MGREHPTVDEGCEDTEGFFDSMGYGCSGWAGFDCTTAEESYGYTAQDQQYVMINCAATCNLCGVAAHPTSYPTEQPPMTVSQQVCDWLPGMVSFDTQDNECCGAAIAIVSAEAIAGGMGDMLGGACLHMTNYADFFPDGCTDCAQPGDAENIPWCTPGSSPTLTTLAAAQVALCCKEVEGGLCHQSIVAGATTGAGAMNSQFVGAFDWDGDGNLDLCAEVECAPAHEWTVQEAEDVMTNCPATCGLCDTPHEESSRKLASDDADKLGDLTFRNPAMRWEGLKKHGLSKNQGARGGPTRAPVAGRKHTPSFLDFQQQQQQTVGTNSSIQEGLFRRLTVTCPSGYRDITGGNAYNWACGEGCAGGSYTDGSCVCACQEDSFIPTFVLVSSGTCETNNREEVSSQYDCEEIAWIMGVSYSDITSIFDRGEWPSGCFYQTSGNQYYLYFNRAVSTASCQGGVNTCICGALLPGSTSPTASPSAGAKRGAGRENQLAPACLF